VDRDSSEIVTAAFTLAGVQAASHIDTEFRNPLGERGGAPNGPCRPVECGQEAVAGVFDFAALKIGDLFAGDRVMALEQLAPMAVAEFGCATGGVDDVGEHNRCQDPIWRMLMTLPVRPRPSGALLCF
jgi:hypothetical protein